MFHNVQSQPNRGFSNNGGVGLQVRRMGNAVQITLSCAHDYAAIGLFDQLQAAGQRGKLDLQLDAANPPTAPRA